MSITDAMMIRIATRPTTVNTRIVSLSFRLPGEARERERGEKELQLKQYNTFGLLTDAIITPVDHSEPSLSGHPCPLDLTVVESFVLHF